MAESHSKEAHDAAPTSQYDHISSIRFTNLLRQLDRAASADVRNSQPSKKRKIGDVSHAPVSTTSTAVRQRFIDWAKVKGGAELERRSIPGHSDDKHAASAYSPFSRPRLLERIATYQLSSYNVRLPSATAIFNQSGATSATPQDEENLSKSVQAIGKWLDPIGPALYGWTHLQPHERFSTTREPSTAVQGGKNKLFCKTCEASWTVSVTATETQSTLASLLSNVQSVHNQHKQWCAWKKRRCDVRLYRVAGGGDEGGTFIGHLSKAKAREAFSSAVLAVETALAGSSSNATIQRPNRLTEDQLNKLARLVSTDAEEAVTSPTLRSATLMTLFGWSLTTAAPSPLFSCSYCARKASLPSQSSRTINPELEHRSFCPWITSESLRDLTPGILQFDGEVESMVDALRKWQHDSSDEVESTIATSLADAPAWQVSLNTLLPPSDRSASPELQREHAQSFSELRESQVARLLTGWFGAR